MKSTTDVLRIFQLSQNGIVFQSRLLFWFGEKQKGSMIYSYHVRFIDHIIIATPGG